MKEIKNVDITVVIQGPIHHSSETSSEMGLTSRSISAIRKYFPGAVIVLSTWEGERTDNLLYDKLILNQDPGPTVVKYHKNGTPHTVNVNRQIVSTLAGLMAVETKYAMKLRSDNILNSDRAINLLLRYPKRVSEHKLTKERIVSSNLFAKEYSQGLPIPFFPSDFFQFGRSEDLLALWDIPLIEGYQYNKKLAGKRQSKLYPWPDLHVEQILWLSFVNKYIFVKMPHKFGSGREQMKLSRKIIANNLIIAERSELDLEVPYRLEQNDGVPYTHYTLKRWEQLYKRFVDPGFVIEGNLGLTLNRLFARTAQYFAQGLKQHVRLWLCRFRGRS